MLEPNEHAYMYSIIERLDTLESRIIETNELLKQLIEVSTPVELPEMTQEPQSPVIRFHGDGL